MTSIRILLLILLIFIAPLYSEDMRSFRLSIMSGWQFQCANTTCLPFITITTSSIRKCQISCLSKTQCQAASFHQSTTYCELFANIPNQDGNMLANAETTTMLMNMGTRIPVVSDSIEETTQETSSKTTQQTSIRTTQHTSSETVEHSTLLPTTTGCTNTLISPTGRAPTIAWYFENNFNDYFGKYNGTGQSNLVNGLGRNGCGKCLNLSSTLSQWVIVNITPYIDFRSISFSVEAWAKPTIVSDGLEHVIFAQCGALATRQCMRVSIGNPGKMSFLFRSDTQLGNRTVPTNVWSHFAYVYNLTAQTMSLYFNGFLDARGSAHGPYLGAPTYFQIGNIDAYNNIYFDGCIDDIFFYPFARTASEIAETFALG